MDVAVVERFAAARVARLATVRSDGRPRVVPVTFAVTTGAAPSVAAPGASTLPEHTIWTAVDHKPKSTRSLARLGDVTTEPRVSLLADHYDDDWTHLWWVRADGDAAIVGAETDDGRVGVRALGEKYPQYRVSPPAGPVIMVRVVRWVAWSADASG